MKRILLTTLFIFLSKFTFSQNQLEKSFYDYLLSEYLIDSITDYNEDKMYFLDSLHAHMELTQKFRLPDVCPYTNEILENTIQTSRCFVGREIYCNLYFTYRDIQNHKDFNGVIDSEHFNFFSKQKRFRYFTCKIFNLDIINDDYEIQKLQCFIIMFYD